MDSTTDTALSNPAEPDITSAAPLDVCYIIVVDLGQLGWLMSYVGAPGSSSENSFMSAWKILSISTWLLLRSFR